MLACLKGAVKGMGEPLCLLNLGVDSEISRWEPGSGCTSELRRTGLLAGEGWPPERERLDQLEMGRKSLLLISPKGVCRRKSSGPLQIPDTENMSVNDQLCEPSRAEALTDGF